VGFEDLLEDPIEPLGVPPDLLSEIAIGMKLLREFEVGAFDGLRVGADLDAEQFVIGASKRRFELEDPALDHDVDIECLVELGLIDRGRNELRRACRRRFGVCRWGRFTGVRRGCRRVTLVVRPRRFARHRSRDDFEDAFREPPAETGIDVLGRDSADLTQESPRSRPIDARKEISLRRTQVELRRVAPRRQDEYLVF